MVTFGTSKVDNFDYHARATLQNGLRQHFQYGLCQKNQGGKLLNADSQTSYTIPRRSSSSGYLVPRHTIPPFL